MSSSIINKQHDYLQILIALSLSGQAIVLYADDTENIYQYRSSEGVTEFTDTVKEDKEPVKHIKIQKMTEQEKAQATERLNQIEQENSELDARLDAERDLKKEQNLQRQKERAQKEKDEEQSVESNDDVEYYNNGSIQNRPIQPRPPIRPKPPVNRPVRPQPVQLPAR